MDEQDYFDSLAKEEEQAYESLHFSYPEEMESGQEIAYDASLEEWHAMQREQAEEYERMQQELSEEFSGRELDLAEQCQLEQEYFEELRAHNEAVHRDQLEELAKLSRENKESGTLDGVQKLLKLKEDKLHKISELQQEIVFLKKVTKLGNGTGASQGKKSGSEAKRMNKLFRGIELASFIIPLKTRKETFEPSFEDAKEDYLIKRRKFRGSGGRIWLASWFFLHTIILVVQSFFSLLSEKGKKALWATFGGIIMWSRGH